MTFKPAADWLEAFPMPAETPPLRLPPARQRTRKPPADAQPEDLSAAVALPPAAAETHAFGLEAKVPTDTIDNESAPASYKVGYKSPPLHTRFRAGQSGNPRGRPKKAESLNTIVRKTLGGKVAVRTANGTKKISRIEAVLQKTLELAMKGNPRAQAELIKLWRSAVPDAPANLSDDLSPAEDLSEADLGILHAYMGRITTGGDDGLPA